MKIGKIIPAISLAFHNYVRLPEGTGLFGPLLETFLICFINLIFLILATGSVILKITVLQVIVMLLEEIKGLCAGFPI